MSKNQTCNSYFFPSVPSILLNIFLMSRRQGLLPKIISGTSGGAAIAAYVCCRTDAELLGAEGAGGKRPGKTTRDSL